MTDSVKLSFAHEFPLNICPYCESRFVLLAVIDHRNWYGRHVNAWPQDFMQHLEALSDYKAFCPFCGEPFNKDETE